MPRGDVEDYRNLSLEDVVRRFGVKLEPAGDKLRGLCPFHRDKESPSFYVFNDGHYFCFGCRAYGKVEDFVGGMLGVTRKTIVSTWIGKAVDANEPLRLDVKMPEEVNFKKSLALFIGKWYNGLHPSDKSLSKLKQVDAMMDQFDFVGDDEYRLIMEILKESGGRHD